MGVTTSALWQLDAVLFARGQTHVVLALAVCAAAGLADPVVFLTLVLVTVAWAGRLTLPFAIWLAAASWAFFTGFVTNQYGQLTFDGSDLARLALLLACAAAAHWRR